jgi:S1-C subfamily serine protease
MDLTFMEINESPPTKNRFKQILARLRSVFPFIGGMLAALGALILYNLIAPGPQPLTAKDVQDTVDHTLASATPAPAYSQRVYQIIQPSLVLIQTKSVGSDNKEQGGLGSGVIIDDQGDILTALHVVLDSTEIQVTFADGTQSQAVITTQQPDNDIAVIKTETLPAQVIPATLGDPRSMSVGDEAYVVGNPFGLYSSMSSGVISGFGRTFKPHGSDKELTGLIQIDAAVNPGNSGGPLLNRDGDVIGIVEGIVSPTGDEFFVGIGFAIPINAAGGGGVASPPY